MRFWIVILRAVFKENFALLVPGLNSTLLVPGLNSTLLVSGKINTSRIRYLKHFACQEYQSSNFALLVLGPNHSNRFTISIEEIPSASLEMNFTLNIIYNNKIDKKRTSQLASFAYTNKFLHILNEASASRLIQ